MNENLQNNATKYGRENPVAIAINIENKFTNDSCIAKVAAVPSRGAEQGMATMVTIMLKVISRIVLFAIFDFSRLTFQLKCNLPKLIRERIKKKTTVNFKKYMF